MSVGFNANVSSVNFSENLSNVQNSQSVFGGHKISLVSTPVIFPHEMTNINGDFPNKTLAERSVSITHG